MAAPSYAVDQGFASKEAKQYEARWLENLLGIDMNPASYALVVGISQYGQENRFAPLPTEADPHAVKDFLIDTAGFDYVHLLTEADVTESRLKTLILDEFRARVGPQDRFFIYWSGHGETLPVATGGTTGFLAFGTSRSGDPATMIEMNALRRWTDFVPAEQLLFAIDACFSGFIGVESMSGSEVTVDLEELRRPSRQILTAGTEEQKAYATTQPRGGGFTRALLEGLSGAADTENDLGPRDGIVTVQELMLYLEPRIRREMRDIGWTSDLDPQLYKIGSSEGTFFFFTPALRKEAIRYGERVSTAETTAMSPGIASEAIAGAATIRPQTAEAQTALRALGFAVGERGRLDRQTEDALIAFQALAGVVPTGRPDATTLAALARMRNQPPTDLSSLRDNDLEIMIVYQIGAEQQVDRLARRLDAAGVRYAYSSVYSMPDSIRGRLYFGSNWTGAALALRVLAEGVVNARLSPSSTSGDSMRLLVGLGGGSDTE
ncbi:peptidoglycan-binding protein [Ruegeria hyattellae]|uniref:peptidoglycan-binding protein n=1 Tax=Ruegeria hyattellae TaxID=3233337 RepID=UPI00355B067E